MSLSARAVVLALVMTALASSLACKEGILGKQYEYEEDLYLALDGSASLVVNASVPALVALRGIDLDSAGTTRQIADKVRAAYQSPLATITRISPPWRRAGRRFIQVRLDVTDVRRLNEAAPFSWSRYTLAAQNGRHVFEQKIGAAALRPGTLQNVGWNGSEVVAFRVHLPSRIMWHNARISRRGSREARRVETFCPGNSTWPIGSMALRSTSRWRWTASRFCIGRSGCSAARSWQR